jgi:hypothetical protein
MDEKIINEDDKLAGRTLKFEPKTGDNAKIRSYGTFQLNKFKHFNAGDFFAQNFVE